MPLDEERRQRIVITHTGSLPRPPALSALLFSNNPGETAERTRATRQAVADIVARQLDLGVDVVSDGEQSKVSFQVYALDRRTGTDPTAARGAAHAGEHSVSRLLPRWRASRFGAGRFRLHRTDRL